MISIRQRLFMQNIVLVLMMLVILWVAISLFLERFYIEDQKNNLLDNYHLINSIEVDLETDSFETFLQIESRSNVEIIITDDENSVIYASKSYITNNNYMGRIRENLQNMTPPGPGGSPRQGQRKGTTEVPSLMSLLLLPPDVPREMVDDNLFFVIGRSPLSENSNIALAGQLDQGHNIVLRTPLASVQASIQVMSRFLLIVGALTLMIAMVMAYLFANRFTKPIKEISRVTGHMKNLDFDELCDVDAQDELGALADNVNDMSRSLSSAIGNLNQANEHLKEEIDAKTKLDEKRRQLLNNVSHELKTPLSLMEGYAEALQLNIHSDPARMNFYCDVIMDETQKMNHLVQGLLDIDQMEFGDTKSQPVKLNLSRYLIATIEKYRPRAEKSGISITHTIPQDLYAMADPLRLEQVFVNYLTNAINYCNEGRQISIKAVQTEKNVMIQVHNTSAPLSDVQLDRIWDSFYKIDKARTREKGGHGLGLSIVKAIQESDGLDYGVKNEGQGVTFWFDVLLA